MIRTFSLSLALTLAACATPAPVIRYAEDDGSGLVAAHRLEPATVAATQIVETPIPLPLPGQLKPLEEAAPRRAAATPAQAVSNGASAARVEPSLDGYVNAVQIYPYTEGALYQLYASPGQVSDIALEPGEELVSVSAGDTVRWVVGDTVSGSGAGARAHVLVKPVAAGLTTNLMIATDRRTYHLELTSLEKSYMAALSWRYPAASLSELKNQNALAARQDAVTAAPDIDPLALDFGYSIEGDRPDWRPLRAFDDGTKVFIQMPPGLAASEAPPLFIRSERNKSELVNYRVQAGYYIVDRLFSAAELRLGERPQTVVRIVKSDRRQKRSGSDG